MIHFKKPNTDKKTSGILLIWKEIIIEYSYQMFLHDWQWSVCKL